MKDRPMFHATDEPTAEQVFLFMFGDEPSHPTPEPPIEPTDPPGAPTPGPDSAPDI